MTADVHVPELAPPRDLAVLARCAGRDRLPDHLAIGAHSELLAIARARNAAAGA